MGTSQSSNAGSEAHHPTLADVALVRKMLIYALRQPPELADLILDFASYAPLIYACRSEPIGVSARAVQEKIMSRHDRYEWPGGVVPEISEVPTPQPEVTDASTAPPAPKPVHLGGSTNMTPYNGPRDSCEVLYLVTDPLPAGRWKGEDVRVKRVSFLLNSMDQGWGGDPGCRGTYRGSYTWSEAVIIRPLSSKLVNSQSDVPVTITSMTRSSGIRSSETSFAPTEKYSSRLDAPDGGLDLSRPPKMPDAHCLEMHFLQPRGFYLASRALPKSEAEKRSEQGDADQIYPKKLQTTWKVQHNVTAAKQIKTHVVDWSCDDSRGGIGVGAAADDVDKVDEATGKGRGEGFIETLKPGDRIGIMARAIYPGWANTVVNASITVETRVRY